MIYTDRNGQQVCETGQGSYNQTRKKCCRMIRSGVTRYIKIHDLAHPRNKFTEVWAGHGTRIYSISADSKERVVWRVNPSDGRNIIKMGIEEP